jgi:hypothetical protein
LPGVLYATLGTFAFAHNNVAMRRGHGGGQQQNMSDGAAFLSRSELAGHARDTAAWRALYGYTNNALARRSPFSLLKSAAFGYRQGDRSAR